MVILSIEASEEYDPLSIVKLFIFSKLIVEVEIELGSLEESEMQICYSNDSSLDE